MKKVHIWRSQQWGTWEAEGGDTDEKTGMNMEEVPASADASSNSIQNLLQSLRKLQAEKHTLELACSIFQDTRVRQLGYMLPGSFYNYGSLFPHVYWF